MLALLKIAMHCIHDGSNAPPFIAGFMCTFILMFTDLPEKYVFLKLCAIKPCDFKQ